MICFTEREQQDLDRLRNEIDKIPNFPSEGVLFYDIFSLLRNPEMTEILFRFNEKVINEINKNLPEKINCIIGLESRGFLLGMVLAEKLKIPFVPIRKKNKLPGECHRITYTTEYSTDTFELQKSALNPESRVLVIDDLLATGGTLKAAQDLVRMANSKVCAYFTIFELEFLKGREKLDNKDECYSLLKI